MALEVKLVLAVSDSWCGGCRHPELAEAAGGICVTGDMSGHVETMSLADLVAARPDVIIFGPCGFHMARSVKDLGEAAWLKSPGAFLPWLPFHATTQWVSSTP